eukprot:g8500.t1
MMPSTQKQGIVASFKSWIFKDPRGNISIVALVGAGVLSLILFVANVTAAIPALIGGIAILSASGHIWTLRNLQEQIDTFSKENAALEETEEKLTEELGVLDKNKKKLTTHCQQLEGTVGELTAVSDGLQSELKGFESLKSNLEKFASETGADVRRILDDAQKLESKMQRMTNDNERSLLGKIAQDLEFMDKDVGMSKYEFNRFMERLPGHCISRFEELGMTFESVAGADNIIDFNEVEKMLDQLVRENKAKATAIS